VNDAQRYIDRITRRAWFIARWGELAVTVRPGHGHRRATGDHRTRIIQLPLWARCERVALHELAHVLTSPPAAHHGPEYARTLLELTRLARGDEAYRLLAETFGEERVRVAPRARVIRVDSTRSKTALRRRLDLASRRRMPPTAFEIQRAIAVLRQAARSGLLGPTGRALRNHALAVARHLESGLPGPRTP
jgi:hypothetical protein